MTDKYIHHARLSPSGSKGWMACAGRIVLEEAFPDRGNEHSDNGTAMHDIAARVLKHASVTSTLSAADYIGDPIKVSHDGEPDRFVTFDADMAKLTQGYVDAMRELVGTAEVHYEQRVEFSDYVGVPGQFGTTDVIALKPIVLNDGQTLPGAFDLIVADLKTGYHWVSEVENSQLMLYALGALARFELSHDIRSVRMVIYQPRHEPALREWSCTVDELLAFALVAQERAQKVEEASDNFSGIDIPNEHGKVFTRSLWDKLYLHPDPNEADCAFCRAMSTCPAKRAKLERIAESSFEVVADPTLVTLQGNPPLTKVDLKTVPVEKLALAMNCAGEFEDWIKAVRAEVERRLLLNEEVPGWGLELGREGARQWTDEDEVRKYLQKTVRLPMAKVFKMDLVSPTTIEKLAGYKDGKKVAKPKTKPLIGPAQWDKLRELVKRSPPSPSVKPLAVIKKLYSPTAPSIEASGFEVVDENADLI